ncbi:MAG: helix-turn-helix transcriptional regulator [Clostridia bacterium]|nr:helix-turn-helix transcriptional regulator [Clostridia bacterium]
MSISENIAKYRKQKGYTQEQLGVILGVTNQAVSKWESAASMPDVMMLPMIAEALGITLNDLYGTTEKPQEQVDRNARIDMFAAEAQNLMKMHLYKQLFADTAGIKDIVKFEHSPDDITKINSAFTVGIISYTANGAAFVSDNLSVVSSNFAIQNGANVFDNQEIASGMKKLWDPNVRKVLRCMYSESFRNAPEDLASIHLFFKDHDIHEQEFSLAEISHSCHLSEDDALEAIEKLSAIHIVNVSHENNQTRYAFVKTKGIETAIVFHVVERLICETFHWGCGYIVGHKAD